MDEVTPKTDHTKDELLAIIYDARVQAMLKLKAQVEEGGAPASVFTALMKAASEVEAMLPERAGQDPEKEAQRIAQEAEQVYLSEDIGAYDPTQPLLHN